ncbi:hypothetical protein SNEBB_009293, partial [Seison nebaliae]
MDIFDRPLSHHMQYDENDSADLLNDTYTPEQSYMAVIFAIFVVILLICLIVGLAICAPKFLMR